MNLDEYRNLILRSEHPNFTMLNKRILHATIGIASEAGEVADVVKKSLFYNRKLDKEKLKEEIGDLLWYIALCITGIDSSFEEIMEQNIAKLKARYPEQFKN